MKHVLIFFKHFFFGDVYFREVCIWIIALITENMCSVCIKDYHQYQTHVIFFGWSTFRMSFPFGWWFLFSCSSGPWRASEQRWRPKQIPIDWHAFHIQTSYQYTYKHYLWWVPCMYVWWVPSTVAMKSMHSSYFERRLWKFHETRATM